MFLKILATAILITSCGALNEGFSHAVPKPARLGELRDKLALYRVLAQELQHPDHGWIYHDNCDGLLWDGLLKFSGMDIDLLAARNADGQWFRTPDQNCYPERSHATISRDMMIGMWFGSERSWREDLWEYAKSKNWKIGEGPIDTVFLTPNFINTLGISIGKGRQIFEMWVDPIKSHQRHIVALNAIYRNLTSNTGLKETIKIMKTLKHHDPDNMVYFYFLAKHGKAPMHQVVDVLLDSPWFPNDRLPTTADRCRHWIWEMDNNRQPCPEQQKVHPGGDFMFIATLVLGDYVIQ